MIRTFFHVWLFVLGYVLLAQGIAMLILEPVRAYDQSSYEGLWLAIAVVTAPLAYLFAANQRRLNLERKARQSDQDLDHLTGLYNRAAFLDQMRDRLQNRHSATTYSLAMIELDHFVELSELYGSRTADRVLQHSASELRGAVRDNDLLCRLDGEVFCLFVQTAYSDSLGAFTRRLLKTVHEHPYSNEGSILELTASCGFTMIQPHDTADDALSQARSALISAKRQGGNRSVVYALPASTASDASVLQTEVA